MRRRTFILRRGTDVTGVSGTGDIAEGVQFENGVVVLAWRPQLERAAKSSVAVWPDLESMVAIHGHDGATRVVWDDADADDARYRTARLRLWRARGGGRGSAHHPRRLLRQ